MSDGSMPPALRVKLPAAEAAGIPMMYPALLHEKRPEPPVLLPNAVQ
jgi:hypothetical protein